MDVKNTPEFCTGAPVDPAIFDAVGNSWRGRGEHLDHGRTSPRTDGAWFGSVAAGILISAAQNGRCHLPVPVRPPVPLRQDHRVGCPPHRHLAHVLMPGSRPWRTIGEAGCGPGCVAATPACRPRSGIEPGSRRAPPKRAPSTHRQRASRRTDCHRRACRLARVVARKVVNGSQPCLVHDERTITVDNALAAELTADSPGAWLERQTVADVGTVGGRAGTCRLVHLDAVTRRQRKQKYSAGRTIRVHPAHGSCHAKAGVDQRPVALEPARGGSVRSDPMRA